MRHDIAPARLNKAIDKHDQGEDGQAMDPTERTEHAGLGNQKRGQCRNRHGCQPHAPKQFMDVRAFGHEQDNCTENKRQQSSQCMYPDGGRRQRDRLDYHL